MHRLCFDSIEISPNSEILFKKKGEKFGHVQKKTLLCTLFCGSSLKAGRKMHSKAI